MPTKLALALTLLALTGATASAQVSHSGQAALDPSRGDAASNPDLQGPAVLRLLDLKQGDRVVDVIAGRFTGLLSRQVGATGKVFAVEPDEVVRVHPQVIPLMQGLASQAPAHNVELVRGPVDQIVLPSGVAAVLIRQNYHDLHDKFMGPADVAAFNRRVFAALRPGGVFLVLDHAAAAGSGLRDTDTLHRIDPAAVKAEVMAAGFRLETISNILSNTADPHDKNVFDPSIRGHTDQFIMVFRKPT